MPAATPDPFAGSAVEVTNPYPERSTRVQGVRQHTTYTPAQHRKITEDLEPVGPFPVAASLPSVLDQPIGRRYPWAAIGLYVLGQVILAAVIALAVIDPMIGILVCLLWMTCGLLLITAQVMSNRQKRPVKIADTHHRTRPVGNRTDDVTSRIDRSPRLNGRVGGRR